MPPSAQLAGQQDSEGERAKKGPTAILPAGLTLGCAAVEDEDELPDRFFRERRLLLAVSALLLAHQMLGISVGKGAETLGLHFDIEDPSRLWWALSAVWGWAMVSSIQQFNALKPWSKYPRDRDEEARVWLSDRVVLRWVRRRALKYLRDNIGKELGPRFDVVWVGRRRADTPSRELLEYASVNVTAQWQTDGQDILEARARAFEAHMEAVGWLAPGGGVSVDRGISEFQRTVNVRVMPIQETPAIRAAARLWTLLSTPFLTDYFAPLVVGIAPLVVVGTTALQGH